MNEDELIAKIGAPELERLAKRAAWSVPAFLLAAFSAVAVVILLLMGNYSDMLTAIVPTVIWSAAFIYIKPSTSQYGEEAVALIYAKGVGKNLGVALKVFGVVMLGVIAVYGYRNIGALGDKAEKIYAAAADMVTAEDEALPVEKQPSAAQSELLEIERQRLALEQERLQLAKEKLSSQAASSVSEPAVADVVAPPPEAIAQRSEQVAIENRSKVEADVSKAIKWLVPYLNRITSDVRYEHYINGKSAGESITRLSVVQESDTIFRVSKDYLPERELGKSRRWESSWSRVHAEFLQTTEIECNGEYDLRPAVCYLTLYAKTGYHFESSESERCKVKGCWISFQFYQSNMETAARIENALLDIIDLMGNREAY